jgi:hypothetical protein
MGYLCLALVTAHMVALGLRGWTAPQHWPAMLPPISMIAAVLAALPVLLFARRQDGKTRGSSTNA